MNIGDLVKLERRKGRPAWIGLVVDTYKTKQLVDREDATSEWRLRPGVIIHWPGRNVFESYDETLWFMLVVINE